MTVIVEHKNSCIETFIEHAEFVCAERSARLTELRKKVLELVWQADRPIKAYDMLSELQKIDPSARPPTIYRALDFLIEHQLIHKLHRLNAYIARSLPHDEKASYFLICSNCGKVEERRDNAYSKLVNKISKQHQFTPSNSTLELEGICVDCRSAVS